MLLALWHQVIMASYRTWFLREVKQSRARLVRELSHMHGFSEIVSRRVTLTDK